MVDVTIVIVLEPKTHALHTAKAEAKRPRRGDIFTVYRSSDVAVLDGSGDYHIPDLSTAFFGYIHVRNVPNARALRMRDVLGANTEERSLRTKVDPDTGLDEQVEYGDPWRTRRFRIPRSVIPVAARNKLLRDGEITVEWTTFRDKIRKKVVSNRFDATTDDESGAVTDEDLT